MSTQGLPRAPAATAIAALLAAVAGCGGGDEAGPAEDELEYELFASTHLLDERSLSDLLEVTEQGTLRFDGTPEALADLSRLDVILAPASVQTPDGLLRLVTQVEAGANGLVVHTLPAPLQVAFQKLHVKLTREVDTARAPSPWRSERRQPLSYTGEYWPTKSFEDWPINGDGDPSTPYDQVRIHGQVEAGFVYTISVDVDWGDVYAVPNKVLECLEEAVKLSFSCDPTSFLPEAVVGFAIDAGARVDLALEGVTFLPYANELELDEKPLEEIPIGPLLFKPRVAIVAKVEGEASSEFRISASAEASARAAASISSNSGPHLDAPTFDRSFGAPTVFATLQARGKVAVGPRLHLRLYDFAGPYASLFVFAEVTADASSDPCWRLTGGVEGDFGVDVVTPDLPVVGHLTLADFGPLTFGVASAEIATGTCEPLTTGPGGGQAGPADQAAFANPDFTPWARSYGDALHGFPGEGPGAQIEWSALAPTIDGRFMLTGSDTNALIKLGTDGAPIWAERLVAPEDWRDTLAPELLPGRVVPSPTGGMFVVAHPYTIVEVNAAGHLERARRFTHEAYRETWLRFTAAAPDGAGGLFVAGTYATTTTDATTDADAWILRLDAQGELQWSARIGHPGQGEMVRTMIPYQGGVVAAGSTWDPTRARWRPFALSLDADGDVRFDADLVADDCSGGELTAHVLDAQVTRDGDLLFAYTGEAQGYLSGLLRLKADGAYASSSSFGPGEPTHLGPTITAVRELSTTGYLAAGHYSGAQTADDWWLAALDALGRPLWARRLGAVDVPESTGRDDDTYPSLVLTNDGGALLAGYGEAHAYPDDALVAMKVFAKDGHITFAPGEALAAHPLTFEPRQVCFHTEPAHRPAQALDVPLEPLDLTVEPLSPQTHQHAP